MLGAVDGHQAGLRHGAETLGGFGGLQEVVQFGDQHLQRLARLRPFRKVRVRGAVQRRREQDGSLDFVRHRSRRPVHQGQLRAEGPANEPAVGEATLHREVHGGLNIHPFVDALGERPAAGAPR